MKQELSEKLYTLIAKDSTWFAKVTADEIHALLDEKAIEQKENKSNTYQTIYTDKELRLHVKTREKGCCYYCQTEGSVFHWLIPQNEGGLETAVNLLYTCKPCRNIKKHLYLTSQEDYLKEVFEIKNRNATYVQVKKTMSCLHCTEVKELEAFKFTNQTGALAYCQACYEINQLSTYFLHDERNQFEGVKTREEIQQVWEEGRIEYMEQNIVKIFDVPKKQRCILCKKMKWKSSFKKNTNKEKKRFCRKCEIEKGEEAIYTVYDYRHKPINRISKDEAYKLEKKRIGKVVSNKSFKISAPLHTYLYFVALFFKERIGKHQTCFAISYDGKNSHTLSKEKMEALLTEGKAEAHSESVIRLIESENARSKREH